MKKDRMLIGLVVLILVAGLPAASRAAQELLGDARVQIALLDKKGAPQGWGDTAELRMIDRCGYRIIFTLEDVGEWSALSLEQPEDITELEINGQKVAYPLPDMRYKTVPGIPVSLLKKGENVLVVKSSVSKKAKKRWKKRGGGKAKTEAASDAAFSLKAMTVDDLDVLTGPVLGNAGTDMITVACRLNMPAEVELDIDGRKLVSPSGLMHMFKVDGLKPATVYDYSLRGRVAGTWKKLSKAYRVSTYPENGPLKFVAMGDSRSNPEVWSRVSAAAAERHPILCAFCGDMVSQGTKDYLWKEEFFDPGKEFLATVPLYAIIGNHEDETSLFNKIFPTPSGKATWEQQVGPMHLISVDGDDDWSKGSDNEKWLEKVLKKSQSKFVFLYSHYPAWSSGKHGKLKGGEPKERQVREGQEVIMPLLAKYNATAMFAGHDHCYERSEIPDGVTMIVTGGAGTDVNEIYEEAAVQNPYSKVFHALHHYCLFSIDGDDCVMTVLTPEGKVLDTRTWQARN